MIDKRSKFILFGLLALILILFVVESTRPRPIRWNESYTSGDKIPFACYILYDQLENLFPEQEITSVDQTPYDFMRNNEDITGANYIFINGWLDFDQVEVEYLMDFASRGNKVFISSNAPYGALADSLNIKANNNYTRYSKETPDTLTTRFSNEALNDRVYSFEKGSSYRYFTSYDSLNTKILSTVMIDRAKRNFVEEAINTGQKEDDEDVEIDPESIPQVDFIETKVGDGAIYYNLNPIAFTNYYLLQPDHAGYVSGALSYLNDGPVYFDDYGKSGRKVVTSPLRFILSEPTLKAAYYVVIVSVLLYLVIGSKRRQRIIPVIKPFKNETVAFTRTIGSMYFESKDYSGIINKKIQYFLEHLRSTYFMDTTQLNATFIKRLSQKSNYPESQTTDLINYINGLRQKPLHTEHELKELTKKIEAFLNR
ncbi:hypothetical protein BST97_00935 [Nonlabens spongiae]|uniref:DUF4350 domain-containing protein n=1 Tax=Nonlabens spongiae TaxID=331648 RepID=A0A1W6MGH9_9FLAO|nr:DUF4350 domain-containing protein [Nonlabens spongiae]ARN76682.1 hypothetical protein BST97_00935 [Nonlabens spongiae]